MFGGGEDGFGAFFGGRGVVGIGSWGGRRRGLGPFCSFFSFKGAGWGWGRGIDDLRKGGGSFYSDWDEGVWVLCRIVSPGYGISTIHQRLHPERSESWLDTGLGIGVR